MQRSLSKFVGILCLSPFCALLSAPTLAADFISGTFTATMTVCPEDNMGNVPPQCSDIGSVRCPTNFTRDCYISNLNFPKEKTGLHIVDNRYQVSSMSEEGFVVIDRPGIAPGGSSTLSRFRISFKNNNGNPDYTKATSFQFLSDSMSGGTISVQSFDPTTTKNADTFYINKQGANQEIFCGSSCNWGVVLKENAGNPAGTNLFEFTVTRIPEPLTILGTATAAGFGAFFKRQINKKKKGTEE